MTTCHRICINRSMVPTIASACTPTRPYSSGELACGRALSVTLLECSTEGFIASPMRASQAEVDPLRDICTTMPRAKRFTGRSTCRTHLNLASGPALVADSDFAD